MTDIDNNDNGARRVAIVPVSPEFMRERLGLPKSCQILDVIREFAANDGDFLLKVEHRNFPPVRPGEVIPRRQAVFRNDSFYGWSFMDLDK